MDTQVYVPLLLNTTVGMTVDHGQAQVGSWLCASGT